MEGLTVVGIRHHSPACARVVRHVIERVRPRFVLIEGPSDMNGRLEEMRLPHQLPIALFSSRQDTEGSSRGLWSPFCAHSPEWVALQVAKEVGAEARFIDLPAWDAAFVGEENRFADRGLRTSDRVGELAAQQGFENTDALWDHLFEGAQPPELLAERLTSWFRAMRADEPADERDAPRERFMRAHIARALAEGGPVVVVCGGFHQPALEMRVEGESTSVEPEPLPEGTRVGSYLVPYSFRRLDSFTGYASGMPSPGWVQTSWELGPERVGEAMLQRAAAHLRAKGQSVSTADLIAAQTLCDGLRQLRGHIHAQRIDVLDGLAGALVKDALDAPLPWSRRGTLTPGTDPMLVELVACFSGDKVGRLAPSTPQPPLLGDAYGALAAVGLEPESAPLRTTADLTTPAGRSRSRVLHRFRVLAIPGFALLRGAERGRGRTRLSEEWSVARGLEADAALIECAALGATLEAATAARLESATQQPGIAALARALVDAVAAGLEALRDRWIAEAAARIGTEPSLAELGAALFALLSLRHGEQVVGGVPPQGLDALLVAAGQRGLWLYEGIQGSGPASGRAEVEALLALRDLHREPGLPLDVRATVGLALRRLADAGAPPALRGASLGMAWSLDGANLTSAQVVAHVRAAAHPATLGDWLSGLLALAREEVTRTPGLLEAIDDAVSGMTAADFELALPSMREALAWFPPRERLGFAERLLARFGQQQVDPMTLLAPVPDAEQQRFGREREQAALARARRFGLTDSLDPAPATEATP